MINISSVFYTQSPCNDGLWTLCTAHWSEGWATWWILYKSQLANNMYLMLKIGLWRLYRCTFFSFKWSFTISFATIPLNRLIYFVHTMQSGETWWCVGSSLSSGILFHNRFFSGSTSDALSPTDCLSCSSRTPHSHIHHRGTAVYSLNTVKMSGVFLWKSNEKWTCVYYDKNRREWLILFKGKLTTFMSRM